MFTSVRNDLMRGASVIAILTAIGTAYAQEPNVQPPAPPATTPQTPAPATTPPAATTPGTPIPQINVTAPKTTPKPTVARKPATTTTRTTATRTPSTAPVQTAEQREIQANQRVVQQTSNLDTRRDEALQPKVGATISTMTQQDLENVPQGSNISVSDLVYQFVGVSQDSTSSGDFHVRNDHANVQFRINGIQMPDGVSGFSQFLETGLFAKFSLITGALPAQYGLHTTGVLDVTTKTGAALSGGSVGTYGGSNNTFTQTFEYGGVTGNTEYFATGRYFSNSLGLENPTGSINAIHDHTELGRFFGYTSTLLDQSTRLVTFTGVSEQRYQIPTNPAAQVNGGGFFSANGTPAGGPYTAFGFPDGTAANVNENQLEKNTFFVMAWQRSLGDVDMQVSYYNRYSELHFIPDPFGDMLFNNIATDVLRTTFVNGVQGDFSYKLNDAHTIRTGFITQGEQTRVNTLSTVQPLDGFGNAIDAPVNVNDGSNLFGWQLGAYIQDEWKILPTVTLNYGTRFDQILQYVQANQVSPRASLTWQPWWATVIHAGYARNFTPPDQDLGRVAQAQLLGVTPQFPNGTTGAVSVTNSGAILPERSDVYDVGIVQQLLPQCPSGTGGLFDKAPVATTNCPSLEVGVDAYYKFARDLIDDGQFGQATLLSAFNYSEGKVEGIEYKAKFRMGNFTLYSNWSMGFEKANTVVSNQAFFTPDKLTFAANNWIYTDHTQLLTGSGGASYLFDGTHIWWLDGTKASATMIYGSGLRSGFANTDHVPAYTQVNLGISKEFKDTGWDPKPFTVRFDVVNLLDKSYEIRDGSGIGVFAPQFGPRRGYFVGFTQKL
jgi:outer membrane receptor protein involved in Fe transport